MILTYGTGGMTTIVAAGAAGFQQLAQPSGGPMVALWNFQNLRIGPQVTVKPTGAVSSFTFSVALAATNTLEMRGLLYYNGAGSRGGTGSRPAESDVPSGARHAAAHDPGGPGRGGPGRG